MTPRQHVAPGDFRRMRAKRLVTNQHIVVPLDERYWHFAVPGDLDECWGWAGSVNPNGYAVLYFEGRPHHAHRFSYQLFNGPIPSGHVIRHRCDNRVCTNPAHLETGTPRDNSRDMVKRNRQCRGERCHAAKLTPDQVREIRARPDALLRELAAEYGVSIYPIYAIRRGIGWRHVD